MSIFFRVVSLAATPFAASLGLTGVAAPSIAQETTAAAVSPIQNVPQAAPVPAVASEQTQEDTTQAADPRPTYASLEEAVAAQNDSVTDDEDAHCLAVAIYHESKGEPLAGQLAVADVIINRTKSHRFPGSVCGVIKQPGQFSFVKGGRLPEPGNSHQFRVASAVAKLALAGDWENPAPKALFFHASHVSLAGHDTVARIGNQVFYR
jgi:N-acetylmuramoyl-L-alanine amidase